MQATLGKVVFFLCLPPDAAARQVQPGTKNSIVAEQLLLTNTLSQQHMSSSLLALYGDVEHTGFYDKLTHRYYITCVLKHLFQQPQHKRAFLDITEDENEFVSFANGLINNTNSLINDSLTALPQILTLTEQVGGWG